MQINTDGTWSQISSSESEFYNPRVTALIVGEIAFNSLLFLAAIYLVVVFFQRHWRFPSSFIGFQLVVIIFIFLDGAAVAIALPGTPMFDGATAADLFRQIMYTLIWVPYMLNSRRVKNTFVRGPSKEVQFPGDAPDTPAESSG